MNTPRSSSAALAPCPACQRHVRADSELCPFCAAVVPASTTAGANQRNAKQRLGHLARYALGVGAVSASALTFACSHEHDSAMVAVYGGPPPELLGDAGTDALHAPAPPAVTPSAAKPR